MVAVVFVVQKQQKHKYFHHSLFATQAPTLTLALFVALSLPFEATVNALSVEEADICEFWIVVLDLTPI